MAGKGTCINRRSVGIVSAAPINTVFINIGYRTTATAGPAKGSGKALARADCACGYVRGYGGCYRLGCYIPGVGGISRAIATAAVCRSAGTDNDRLTAKAVGADYLRGAIGVKRTAPVYTKFKNIAYRAGAIATRAKGGRNVLARTNIAGGNIGCNGGCYRLCNNNNGARVAGYRGITAQPRKRSYAFVLEGTRSYPRYGGYR